MAECADCGLAYGDPGFADLVIPDAVFQSIHDESRPGDGLLCPNCLIRRAAKAGLENVEARFQSGPFARDDEIKL